MKSLPFKKIDAFTDGSSSGNPAGYIWMEPGQLLSDAEMQKIALELKGFVNEVGFVHQQGEEFYLRYFSSECEVAFCGHATIAILYDLLVSSPTSPREVNIHVNAGPLTVYNYLAEQNAVLITAPAPQYLPCPVSGQQVAGALGLNHAAFDASRAIRLIDGGLKTLIVPLTSLDDCLNLLPHQENLRQFCLANGIDIVHVSTPETASPAAAYRTRVFAPKFGYLEDPATGSGNSAFAYYLLDEKLWRGDLCVEQGPSRENPNFVQLKTLSGPGGLRVLFGGCATTRIEGVYRLF